MWVFLNNSFMSIVEYKEDNSVLLVRARFEGDIERIFPEAITFEKKASDYKFRALIDRRRVAEVMAEQVMKIDYSNFKNSVQEEYRHDVYSSVWFVMYKEQIQREKLNVSKGNPEVLQLPPMQTWKVDNSWKKANEVSGEGFPSFTEYFVKD